MSALSHRPLPLAAASPTRVDSRSDRFARGWMSERRRRRKKMTVFFDFPFGLLFYYTMMMNINARLQTVCFFFFPLFTAVRGRKSPNCIRMTVDGQSFSLKSNVAKRVLRRRAQATKSDTGCSAKTTQAAGTVGRFSLTHDDVYAFASRNQIHLPVECLERYIQQLLGSLVRHRCYPSGNPLSTFVAFMFYPQVRSNTLFLKLLFPIFIFCRSWRSIASEPCKRCLGRIPMMLAWQSGSSSPRALCFLARCLCLAGVLRRFCFNPEVIPNALENSSYALVFGFPQITLG